MTKIAYVHPKILPQPIEFYAGMPVVPVTNSMSAQEYKQNMGERLNVTRTRRKQVSENLLSL